MIEPHGGTLINRVLKKREILAVLKDQKNPRIVVSSDVLLDLENIGVGVYSPLEGFMTKKEFNSVVQKNCLLSGLPWTLPVVFALNEKESKNVSQGMTVLLSTTHNEIIGCIGVEDKYRVDKDKAALKIYGTKSKNHPGVEKFLSMGDVFIGGKIFLFKKNTDFFNYTNLEPFESRKIIKKKKWKTVAGFQTRNVPHRAHEYLQKQALSILDGVFVHPIIGWKKKGDFRPEVVMKAYDILLENYYPKGRYLLSGFTTAMRYAGPKEAVFHAIIRKNFGCTHFVVGRDHAGVGVFYDTYAAHEIFDKLPNLGVTPLLLRGPYYCKKCLNIVNDKVCPHIDTPFKVDISATNIREMITENKKIDQKYFRKEVAEYVSKKGEKCFI